MGKTRQVILTIAALGVFAAVSSARAWYEITRPPAEPARQENRESKEPTPSPRPSPISIRMDNGTCVEQQYRDTWTISEGETAGDIAIATLNGVEDWLGKAYKILILNEAEAEEYSLPVGQKLLTFNGWQKPRIILPERPIELEPGQPFVMIGGLEGFLCDSAHLELQGNYIGDFSPGTNTFRFVPKPSDAGTHKLLFRAGDADITTYGAASYKASAKSPSVLRVEGTVELRVKVKP